MSGAIGNTPNLQTGLSSAAVEIVWPKPHPRETGGGRPPAEVWWREIRMSEVLPGSGNVFEDLGLPDAEELQAKPLSRSI